MEKFDYVLKDKGFIYSYRNKLYIEQPSGTKVTHVQYDAATDANIKYCKHKVNFYNIFMIIVIIGLLLLNMTTDYNEFNISYEDTVHSNGYIVGLNVTNPEENIYTMDIELWYKSESLLNDAYIAPGQSIGNIKLKKPMDNGSYMCELRCTVRYGAKRVIETYDVLLVVDKEGENK